MTLEQMQKAFVRLCQQVDRIELQLSKVGQSPGNDVMHVEEVASMLGYSKQTIYTKVMRRELPHKKKGRRLYFLRNELLSYINNGHRKTVDEIKLTAQLDLTKNKNSKNARRT